MKGVWYRPCGEGSSDYRIYTHAKCYVNGNSEINGAQYCARIFTAKGELKKSFQYGAPNTSYNHSYSDNNQCLYADELTGRLVFGAGYSKNDSSTVQSGVLYTYDISGVRSGSFSVPKVSELVLTSGRGVSTCHRSFASNYSASGPFYYQACTDTRDDEDGTCAYTIGSANAPELSPGSTYSSTSRGYSYTRSRLLFMDSSGCAYVAVEKKSRSSSKRTTYLQKYYSNGGLAEEVYIDERHPKSAVYDFTTGYLYYQYNATSTVYRISIPSLTNREAAGIDLTGPCGERLPNCAVTAKGELIWADATTVKLVKLDGTVVKEFANQDSLVENFGVMGMVHNIAIAPDGNLIIAKGSKLWRMSLRTGKFTLLSQSLGTCYGNPSISVGPGCIEVYPHLYGKK